jgi:hypothetical protein
MQRQLVGNLNAACYRLITGAPNIVTAAGRFWTAAESRDFGARKTMAPPNIFGGLE